MLRECWEKWDPLSVDIVVLKVCFYQKRDQRIRLKLYLLLLQSVNDKVKQDTECSWEFFGTSYKTMDWVIPYP